MDDELDDKGEGDDAASPPTSAGLLDVFVALTVLGDDEVEFWAAI